MADLATLRAIVGDEPSDSALKLLLRDGTVEAAANRFFEASAAPAAAASTTGKRPSSAAAATPSKERRLDTSSSGAKPAGSAKPLAERMRPSRLDDLLGQGEALDAVLRQSLCEDRLPSLLLWGPPGCGKTSFAACVAASTQRLFRSLSAAKCGVSELREELSRAANALRLRGVGTILFVDEIHRWSKAQQDALLMDVEKGTVTLVGATTENPSFSVNNAILSRCRLVLFRKVDDDALSAVLDRAIAADAALQGAALSPAARRALVAAADGDARVLLNTLELAAAASRGGAGAGGAGAGGAGDGDGTAWAVHEGAVLAAVQRRATYYDRNGDFHYSPSAEMLRYCTRLVLDASHLYEPKSPKPATPLVILLFRCLR